MNYLKRIGQITIYIFAIIGFVLVVGYVAIRLGWTNTQGIVDNQRYYIKNQLGTNSGASSPSEVASSSVDMAWARGEQWQVLKEAIQKDTSVINKVGGETSIPSRIIVASLIVEQLRLFNDNREVYKSVFAPLKILGNQSQFSWGVMGIKQDTARAIEAHLKDTTSPWYLGAKYEHTLDYTSTTTDVDSERFNRLTNEHDRRYSYLSAAIYMKQVESQWQNAGFPIDDRPDVVATLFNIGFNNSHPHTDPLSGGAEIDVENQKYSFGSLAQDFYSSNELIDEFPR